MFFSSYKKLKFLVKRIKSNIPFNVLKAMMKKNEVIYTVIVLLVPSLQEKVHFLYRIKKKSFLKFQC